MNKVMTLEERLIEIDLIQARRFVKLRDESLAIAVGGIVRHLRACERMEVNPDASAIREIIDDAVRGNKFYPDNPEIYDASLNHWHRRQR